MKTAAIFLFVAFELGAQSLSHKERAIRWRNFALAP